MCRGGGGGRERKRMREVSVDERHLVLTGVGLGRSG